MLICIWAKVFFVNIKINYLIKTLTLYNEYKFSSWIYFLTGKKSLIFLNLKLSTLSKQYLHTICTTLRLQAFV